MTDRYDAPEALLARGNMLRAQGSLADALASYDKVLAMAPDLVPALGQDSPDRDRSIAEALPLFAQNHCEQERNAANQLFCGDRELNAIHTPRHHDIGKDEVDRAPIRKGT